MAKQHLRESQRAEQDLAKHNQLLADKKNAKRAAASKRNITIGFGVGQTVQVVVLRDGVATTKYECDDTLFESSVAF